MDQKAAQPSYLRTPDEVLAQLSSRGDGLKQTEVTERLQKFGENKLAVKNKISPLSIFLSQFKNTLTLILLGSAVLILFIYFFGEKEQSDLIEAGLIFAITLMITVLGFFQEYKAEKAVESLKKLLAFKTKVRREGVEQEIEVSQLVPGDIVILEEGEKIPADMRILENFSLQVIEAPLTGESTPVSKTEKVLSGTLQIADQKNMLFSGTTIASGRGIAVVVTTGNTTEIGKIATSVAQTTDDKTPLQKHLDDIGKKIGFLVLTICVGVFIFIFFFADDFAAQSLLQKLLHSFIAAVALAVAAIPEGLPAVVTISLALGTQRMLKKNALVRKLNSVETLGATDVICSDKTGTLTKGEMTVQEIFVDGKTLSLTGTGFDTNGQIEGAGLAPTLPFLLTCGLICNNARLSDKGALGDPTEVALLVSAVKGNIKTEKKRLFEVPFSSNRKMMSVIIEDGEKVILFAKGAPETILMHSATLLTDSKTSPLTETTKKQLIDQTLLMSQKALRTLGFAYRTLSKSDFELLKETPEKLEESLTFLGLQGMIDPPRTEVKELITACQQSGIRVIMITGDHIETAKAVAAQIGIPPNAASGTDLEKMDEQTFLQTIETISVYARVNPEVKYKIVAALQKKGHIVAMTGDGVNDAPALKKADIGIAMGITGTDVSKEASDMVLLDDHFSTIVRAIEEGRGIYSNIKKFVQYLLTCNIAEVLVVLFALIFFRELPLSATMLLWINVVTDGLPAVALGMDPTEKNILRYSPKTYQSRIIDRRIWLEMLLFAVLLTVGVLGMFIHNLPEGLEEAKGAAFVSLVIFELVELFIIRGKYHAPFRSNHWLFLAVGVSFFLQLLIVSVPSLAKMFEVGGIDLVDWGMIACIAGILWILFSFVTQTLDHLHGKKTPAQ